MRLVFQLILVLLLSAASASAQITYIGGTASAGDSGTVTTTAQNFTGANMLVVCVANFMAGFSLNPTPTDSSSNTWVSGPTYTTTTGDMRIHQWHVLNATVSSSHTVTVTEAGSYPSVAVMAFSGVATSSAVDQSTGQAVNTDEISLAPGSITPTEDNELATSCLGVRYSGTGDPSVSGATSEVSAANVGAGMGVGLARTIQTTAAAFNPTWSWSAGSPNAGTNVSFKSAAGGGGMSAGGLGTLGVGR